MGAFDRGGSTPQEAEEEPNGHRPRGPGVIRGRASHLAQQTLRPRHHRQQSRPPSASVVSALTSRKFWTARVVWIFAQVPFILWMQLFRPDWLVPYIVWMSWMTWVSSELPSAGRD